MHELKGLGISIALDDFGTGYSSLSYLQQLPIDVLKIDKSFIDGIDTHPDRAVLVNTVLRMGRALRLRTIAEGIEDADQLELLQRLGCQRGQGFHLSVPLRADAVGASSRRTRPPVPRPLVADESTATWWRCGSGPCRPARRRRRSISRSRSSTCSPVRQSRWLGASPGVLALVRHYIDAWRGVARFGADVHVGRLRAGNRPAAARPRVDPHRRCRRGGPSDSSARRSRAVPTGRHDGDPRRVSVDGGRVRRCHVTFCARGTRPAVERELRQRLAVDVLRTRG